jgi:hypothetical protein
MPAQFGAHWLTGYCLPLLLLFLPFAFLLLPFAFPTSLSFILSPFLPLGLIAE